MLLFSPRGGRPARRPARLQLEALEGRWVPTTVTNLDDAGPGSLRDALVATPAGGTIDFDPGLTGSIQLWTGTLEVTKNLTIAGPAGTGTLIGVAAGNQFGCFRIASGVTASISYLEILTGRAPTGGGLLNHGTLTLDHVFLEQNTAEGDGGGIWSDGTLTITSSTVSFNTANSGFSGTASGNGGGIYIAAGSLTLTDSTVALNDAKGPTAAGSGGDGGGIWVGGSATIRGSTIWGNTATAGIDGGGFGGGIEAEGAMSLTNCTLTQNTAVEGGAVNQLGGASTLTLVNCTVAENTATSGGGLANSASRPLNLTNTIVAVNTESGGASTTQDIAGAVSAADHSLLGVGDPASGVDDGVNGNQVGTLADPIDPSLGTLTTSNGGITPLMELLAGSPAINAGNNAAVTAANFPGGPPFTDQRGTGFTRIANGTVDIGAFEVQAAVVELSPAALPNGQPGVPYNQTITASGAAGPFTFTVTSGSLPVGLSLSSSGTIAGTPVFWGDSHFTITAENGANDSGSLMYTLTIDMPPGIGTQIPLAVGGPTTGAAMSFRPDPAGQYINPMGDGIPTPFPGLGVNVRMAVGDVNGDGWEDIIMVTGPGIPIRVAVMSGKERNVTLVPPFDPFGGNFTGGGFAASADIDGDGFAEFAVTPDQGGGPRVTIFSLVGTDAIATRANFLAIDDSNFRGGARPALGDVDGDGTPDLLVAAGFGGGPRVALFDGDTVLGNRTKLVGDFFAFPEDAQTLRNGVFAALGDVNGDGFADLAFGGGPGGGPRVYILSGQLLMTGSANLFSQPVANFFVANNSSDRGGVRLAVKDADGDTKADVIAGSGEGSTANVRVYLGKNFTTTSEPTTFQDISVFGGGVLPGGVFVG